MSSVQHLVQAPSWLAKPITTLVLTPITPPPPVMKPGPFFCLQSRCEDDPTYMPWFCVMRGQCDILFPPGTVARAYGSQEQAEEAASYCNQLVTRIQHLYDLLLSAGALGILAYERQAEGLMEEIWTHCFLSERELASPEYQQDLAYSQEEEEGYSDE